MNVVDTLPVVIVIGISFIILFHMVIESWRAKKASK